MSNQASSLGKYGILAVVIAIILIIGAVVLMPGSKKPPVSQPVSEPVKKETPPPAVQKQSDPVADAKASSAADFKAAAALKDRGERSIALKSVYDKYKAAVDPAAFRTASDALKRHADLVREPEARTALYNELIGRYPDRGRLDDWEMTAIGQSELAKARLSKNEPEKLLLYNQIIEDNKSSVNAGRRQLYAQAQNQKASILTTGEGKKRVYDAVMAIPLDWADKKRENNQRLNGAEQAILREMAFAANQKAMLSEGKEKMDLYQSVISRFDWVIGNAGIEDQVFSAKLQLAAAMSPEQAINAYDHMIERYGESTNNAIKKKVAQAVQQKQKLLGAQGAGN